MDGGVSLGIAAARRLAEPGCREIAPGSTDAEFARIEAEWGLEFADDHRAFLAAGLPVNSPFEPELFPCAERTSSTTAPTCGAEW